MLVPVVPPFQLRRGASWLAARAVTDHEIRIDRGPITEWYRNVPGGLEQGFTVTSPVAAGDLVVDLTVSGSAPLRLAEGGYRAEAVLPGGRLLTYDHLAVVDAAGQVLASHMTVTDDRLSLVADITDAAWPVTVDPIINVQQQHVFASDAATGDDFGFSVAVSGDTMVVGATLDDTAAGADAGSAHVYTRTGTTWTQQAHLFASDTAASDEFGFSVAVSGDTAVVGAIFDDTAAGANAGSAYGFVPGGFWVNDASITEGNSGTSTVAVTVTLSAPYPITTSVEVHTYDATATSFADYVPVHKTVTFAAGQTAKTVLVTIKGDTAIEPDESFAVTLANAIDAPIDQGTGEVTILSDDFITVSIADATTVEGASGTKNLKFVLTLSAASTVTVSVNATTADGTALAGSDYTTTTKPVSFPAGVVSKTFAVPIVGDTVPESTETFVVALSSPSGVTLGDANATGTITDTD